MEKAYAKFKCSPIDFIVEEVGKEKTCKISEEFKKGVENESLNLLETAENEKRDFIWCDLEKYNIEHFSAIKNLARALGKGTDSIGYAGSKDKKAWTCQRITLFQPNIEKLENLDEEGIYLKNFKFGKRKIKLGYLEGNRFRLVLRDLEKKEAIKISNAIRGSPQIANYFGPQRFGSMRGNNARIGWLIVKRKFKEAVMEILTDAGENEKEEVKEAREKLTKEEDFKKALKYFPSFLRLERTLLEYLSKNPDDFIGAIKRCERKRILMFVNALQSKMFNEILEVALEEKIDFRKKGQQRVPLFGYRMHFTEGKLGEIEQQILEENDVVLDDFNVLEIPHLRIKGSYRDAIIEVKDLEVQIEDDNKFEGMSKINLQFTLPSGVYATTFLSNFFDLEEN